MMRHSQLMDTTARGLFHITLLISAWLTLRGHNEPGGGFAGGLVAATGFVMVYLARGAEPLRRQVRIAPSTLIGVGLAISGATGMASLITGNAFLESDINKFTLPLVGEVKFVTSVIFDLGVYLLVVGVVLMVITELGTELSDDVVREISEQADHADQAAADRWEQDW
jgi:multicomponent Na+:H+ antiporter subunit A